MKSFKMFWLKNQKPWTVYVAPLMTPRLVCYLQWMILVLDSSLMIQHVWNGFRVWGRWWWWWFLEVVPCRLSGPAAPLHGTVWHVSEWWCFPVITSHCSSHGHNAFGNWRTLWEAWMTGEMKTWHRSVPLARGYKAWSGFGQGGRDALWLIQPSLIMHTPPCNLGVTKNNKDTALKTFLNSQMELDKLHFLPLTILFNLYWIWGLYHHRFYVLNFIKEFYTYYIGIYSSLVWLAIWYSNAVHSVALDSFRNYSGNSWCLSKKVGT